VGRLFLSPPDVGAAERAAVTAAVDSGWVAPVGPELEAFEADLAGVTGRRHAVALASGTAALFLALRELGVGPGDEVIVASLTFIGSVAPVVHLGATPVFVDADAASWTMAPSLLAEAVTPRTKVVVPVDLYGRCANHDAIGTALGAAASVGPPVVVIDDAAEAIGATVDGRPAGSFGQSAILSFNGNKIVTSSGGGALVTDDAAFAARTRHLATQAREPAPHYEHVEVGFNERLSNVSAAIGRAQLATLPERIERRRTIRARYEAGLGDLPGIGWNPVDDDRHRVNHWLTCITIDPGCGVTPESVRLALEAADVESRPVWKPMHRQPVFAGARAVLDGTSDRLFATGLCLPSGGAMTVEEQDRVIGVVREVWGT
jgi:dTDP-4-amino-4,6-dideoxygalactose transaminase